MGVAILGPVVVDGEGTSLAPRDRVVLAALAVRPGEVVSAEQLAEALWRQEPPASWSKVLQGCVMRIRRVLGASAVATTPHGYRLVLPGDEVDACRFERLLCRGRELLTLGEPDRAAHLLGEALALWQGRPLVELEEWEPGRIEAERLGELRLDAEELRLEAALRAGRSREVLAEAQTRVAEVPVRERRWALLALAQYQAGRQAEALRTLRRARGVLAGELGIDPGPELVALEQAILRQDPALVADTALPEPSATCPYLGLVPYDVGDGEAFFGRDNEVAACLRSLAAVGVLAVVGPSGSGKSSLVRAGVAAALQRDGRPIVVVTPGARPVDALCAVRENGVAPVLVVDQCEEAITLCDDAVERTRFFAALTAHAEHGPLVVALRADRLGDLSAHPDFARLVERNLHLLAAMSDAELRAAIEGPAHRAGLLVEPGLVDVLVQEVEGEPGALPLLSHALRQTWGRREGRTLTVAGYRTTGGIRGAVAQSAEQVYGGLPPDHRTALRDLLLRLVIPTPDGQPVRGRVPRRIVATDDEHEQLIEQLVAARLVTSDDGVVELAHESLARAWPRLRDWLDDDVEGQRILRHLTTAADAWQVMARPDSELYRGARLAQALEWREQAKPDLSPTERAFLDTSAQLADAEQRSIEDRARHQAHINRRLRALLAGVAILLVAAVAAGTLAIIQRGEARDSAAAAREAETAQLAQRLGAQALVEEDLDLSLLLARQAVAIDDTPQTRGYLLAELLRSPAAIGIMHIDGDGSTEWNTLRVVALSPDGKTLAIGGPLLGPFFFDARTYEQIGKPPTVTRGVEALAYSPDGATLAVGGFGLRLLDTRTHEVLAEVPNIVSRVAFTNDGSRLAVVESVEGGEAWITIRDAATLQPIGSPIRPAGFGGLWLSQWWTDPSIAWSPDGGSLVTASTAGELAWWDVETGQQTRTFEIDQGYRALAVSPDGLTAAIGLDDGIGLLDVRTRELHEARGTLATNPNWLLFSPDGETVVSTGRDGAVTLWDVGTATPRETLRGHADAAWQPVFSADGETLYTASADGTAIAWDVGGVRRFGGTFTFTDDHGGYAWPDRHPGRFSPDGQLIAVGLNTEGIQLWDAAELAPAGAPMLDTGGEVATLAFSPDGDTLAAVTAEGIVTVWDIETRSLRHAADRGESFFMDISADGRMLATPSGKGVRLWDVATGASLGDIGDGLAAGDVAFSPTEPVVAFLGDGYRRPGGGRTEIWDLAGGSLIRALQVDSTDGLGWALAFSVDGRMLATGGGDPLVHLWDVQSGQLIREIEQNVGSAVWSFEFSPDGQTLAMSGGDGFASLWDVATGAQIGPRFGVGSREAMLDLSNDGQHLLLTNGNGEGAVWDADPESWVQRACALANRSLSPDEWEEFLPGRRYEPACDKPAEGRQR